MFNTVQLRRKKRMLTPEKPTEDNMPLVCPTLIRYPNSWEGFKYYDISFITNLSTLRWCTRKTKQYPNCNQDYIMCETARPLDARVKEHLSCRKPLSAISEHKVNTGHRRSVRDEHINWHRRNIKEAREASLNRDIGQELPPVMLQLVSHDVGHVTLP